MYNVVFYKTINGGYVQTETSYKNEILTKKELMQISDLRHPILNKKEFFDCQSTEKNGITLKKEFTLLSNNNDYLKIYLVVKNK